MRSISHRKIIRGKLQNADGYVTIMLRFFILVTIKK